MTEPLVSVIIPAYKQAAFLGEAIASVLNQSYTNLEVIVVDDASPDDTAAVVASFVDPRLRYIAHDRNRMLAASRNTGMRAARGELLALLDADDYFGPDKLALHVAYLRDHPQCGVTYNSRYELNCRSNTIRNMWRVPLRLGLADVVLGFPFSPSDMVLRREWAFAVDLFDESYVHFSEDMDINCRLALAGCQFGGIDRSLNYRRYHAGRVIRNTRQRLDASLAAVDRTLNDPRTPEAVRSLRSRAYANNYIVWATEALRQGDTQNGLDYLRSAVVCLPSILSGEPNEVTDFFLNDAIYDEGQDHVAVYRSYIAQLTDEFAPVKQQADWAIARAWLVKGYRCSIWGSQDEGRAYLGKGRRRGGCVDDVLFNDINHQLLGLQLEQGPEAAEQAARCVEQNLRAAGYTRLPSLVGRLQLSRAFADYYAGQHAAVPGSVLRAIGTDPRHVLNRGALSILVRSALHSRMSADGSGRSG